MESHTQSKQAETFVIHEDFYQYCMETPMSYFREADHKLKNNQFFFDYSGSGRTMIRHFPVDEYAQERNGQNFGREPTRQECMPYAHRFVNDHILGREFQRMESFALQRLTGRVITSLQLTLGYNEEDRPTRLIQIELLEAILSSNGAGLSLKEFKILLFQFFKDPIAFFRQDKHRQLVQSFFDVNIDVQLLMEKFDRVNTSFTAIDDAEGHLSVMVHELNSTYSNAATVIDQMKNEIDFIHYEEFCELKRISQTIREGLKQIRAFGTLDRSVTTLRDKIDFRYRQNGQFREYRILVPLLVKDLEAILFDINGFLHHSKILTKQVSLLTRTYEVSDMQWTAKKFCEYTQKMGFYGITGNKVVMPFEQVKPSSDMQGRMTLPKKKTIALKRVIRQKRQARISRVGDNKERVQRFNYAMFRFLGYVPPVNALYAKRCNAKRPWETPKQKIVLKIQRKANGKFIARRQYKKQEQRMLFKLTKPIRKEKKQVSFEKIRVQRAPRSKEDVQQIFIVERAARREQLREERKSDWEQLGFASELDFMMLAEEDRRLYRKYLEEEDPRIQEHFADQIVLRSLFKRL